MELVGGACRRISRAELAGGIGFVGRRVLVVLLSLVLPEPVGHQGNHLGEQQGEKQGEKRWKQLGE